MEEFYFVMGSFEGNFILLKNDVFVTYEAAKKYADSLSTIYGAFIVKQVKETT